ncbi:pilus assembly protein PilX [Xylophilus sp.]|uniref:pilus assembly protein PilX n=1 Tax=Xylophilus sp. TaxID=2653893 RepID=UPI0013BB2EE1|nr:pilus assembly protein PilX [Xylophilus sp.]KAF1046655.1 MAG: hypothetical protein GAK38_02391 [Xylophilus sp.]
MTPPPLRHRQRGLSLLVALLALAALALAATALVRSVHTGSLVAGNVAFKQDATAASDQAVRQAIAVLYAKLSASTSGLDADLASSGYYASADALLDATGAQLGSTSRKLVDWDGDSCAAKTSGTYASCSYAPATISTAINGNAAKYIVFRLCDAAGSASSADCAFGTTASTSSSCQGEINYKNGGQCADSTLSPYYRIVVRVRGARNTTSFTETIVHF